MILAGEFSQLWRETSFLFQHISVTQCANFSLCGMIRLTCTSQLSHCNDDNDDDDAIISIILTSVTWNDT